MPAFNMDELKDGVPVAEIVPARQSPFPLGAGRNDPTINREALESDEWWHPMTNKEYQDFLNGR
jgi:hypothetical protein